MLLLSNRGLLGVLYYKIHAILKAEKALSVSYKSKFRHSCKARTKVDEADSVSFFSWTPVFGF